MRELGKFLGWVGFYGYLIALSNFIIKYIYKKYIIKLPKEQKKYADIYKFIMKYIVKYHKLAGIIASIAIVFHFYLMYMYVRLSTTGLISAIIMWIIFTLGVYGVKIGKNVKGSWVKVHRILSIILIAILIIHVL